MCVLSIKVPIGKMFGNLFNDPRMSTNYLQALMLSNISILSEKYFLADIL